MPPDTAFLDAARRHHQAGDLDRAERGYRQALDADPQQAEAWAALGEISQRQGRLADALAHFQQAVRLQPESAPYHTRLGMVLGELGKLDEAVHCYRRALTLLPECAEAHYHLANALAAQGKSDLAAAGFEQVLRLRPDHAEALSNLGVTLARLGKLEDAVARLRRAVEVRPEFARAHHNLGVALAEQRRYDDAVASFAEALRLQPDYAEAHCNLGNTLRDMNRREQAVASYRRALQARPDYAEALNNLGLTLNEAGRSAEAVVYLRQAARLRPEYLDAWNNLGLALADLGRFPEAVAAYERALRLDPRHADTHTNLGSAFKADGRLEEAVACYGVALWLNPGSASARWNRALAWLQTGDFERGWPEYEWRWRRKKVRPPAFRQPAWDGSPLGGRTVLLHPEQGLGDLVQFVRYAALVRERGGRVLVGCPSFVASLFATCPGVDRVVDEAGEHPDFDVQAPLLSLPRLFGTTLATVPARVPYLFPDPALVGHWGQLLRAAPGFRVGVVWQGNPHHPWDRHRSVPLHRFEPLARVEGVRLISLQKGTGAEQLDDPRVRFPVARLETDFPTFLETAAVMKNLDLVVSVDTSTAHLAGAVGVPVWVPLSTMVDWRWLLDREDSPWYPTMRLFRQKELGRWDPVFRRMAQELRRLVGGTAR